MKWKVFGIFVAGAMALPVWAQDIKMPVNLDKLAEHAAETVDVTLDASMLQLASRFLSKDDPDEVRVKQLVSKLKGIYVRSFEFDKDGQYPKSDVEAIRAQLKGPGWTRMLEVRSSKGDNSDIYLHKTGDRITGLVVLAAEPKELTIVHIDGPIDPAELSELGGHMGIPKLDRSGKPKPKSDE